MKIKAILIWLSAFIIVAFLVWLVAQKIEFYEAEEHSRWSSKARSNPYLAAIKFLKQSDVDVLDINNFNQLKELQTTSTLLVTNSSQINNARQFDKVMSWLNQGGNLIMVPSLLRNDYLLSELGINVKKNDIDNSITFSDALVDYNNKVKQGKSAEEIEKESEMDVQLTRIKFTDITEELNIAFDSTHVLEHSFITESTDTETEFIPSSWSSSEDGVQLIQFMVGEGTITLLSDMTIWNSFRIDEYDHAYLLWLLIDNNGHLAILHNPFGDSIWTLMQQHASEFILALCLFVGFMLWHKMYRLGRIEHYSQNKNRSLSEHFYTTANFLWHRQSVDALLVPLRNKILRQSNLRQEQLLTNHDSRQQNYKLLSKQTNISLEHIQMAFESSDNSELNFIKIVRILNRIEKLL